MSLLIMDSHISIDEKINNITSNNNCLKYYLIFNEITIDDINKLLSIDIKNPIEIIFTRTQNFKLSSHLFMLLMNRFKITYLNNLSNMYHYEILKYSNHFTATNDNLNYHILDSDKHYLLGLLESINIDNELEEVVDNNIKEVVDNDTDEINKNKIFDIIQIISNKNINNLPDTLKHLNIVMDNNTTNQISLKNMSIINQNLKFVHISKCAGTIIEDIAKDLGIFWGRYDVQLCKENLLPKWSRIKSDYYHLVPDCYQPNIYNLDNSNDMKTFCVIREPYSRIVSEVFCNWIGILKNNSNPTILDYNKHIEKYLNFVETRFNLQHWWPQHKFIYDADGNKMVDYVLRMDNLNQEFNDLMREYNLPLQLNSKTNESNKMYGLKDIFTNNLSKINKIYKKDFELFGSEMIEVNNVKKLIEDNKIVVISHYFLLEGQKIDYQILEDFVSNYKNMDILFYHNDDDIKDFIEMMNDEKNEKLQNRFKFVKLRIEDLINDFIKIEELNNDNLDNIASLLLPKIIYNYDLLKQFDNKSHLILFNVRYKIILNKFSINDNKFNFIIDSNNLNLSEILTIMKVEKLTEYKELFYTIVNDIKKNKESISPKKLLNNVLLELKNNYSDKIAIIC
jgi:hypothetical protein